MTTYNWRDDHITLANEAADAELAAEFKKDLGELLKKYKAEMNTEMDFLDSASINFYSPSEYKDGERTKANLDVYFKGLTEASDLT